MKHRLGHAANWDDGDGDFSHRAVAKLLLSFPVGFWQAQSIQPILDDPGPRALFVRDRYIRFFSHGDACADLKANLQAGHAYQIKVELKKQDMTFWVEDQANHEAVSDRQTAKASWEINLGGV